MAIAFGLVGGALVGGILKLPIWGDPADANCFDDEVYWEVPEDEDENILSRQPNMNQTRDMPDAYQRSHV